MAEHYGVKPKAFTKEWWPYFWMYYKWHVVAVVVMGIFVITGVTQCVNKEHYDLEVAYSGDKYYEDSVWTSIETELEEDIADIDDDGEKNIRISPIVTIDEPGYEEQNYTMQMKHVAELTSELMCVCIYDKRTMEQYDESITDSFCMPQEWLDFEVDEDMIGYSKTGKACAVSLKNSSILKSAGIDCEDLYVLVKMNTDKSGENNAVHENAVTVANNLVK